VDLIDSGDIVDQMIEDGKKIVDEAINHVVQEARTEVFMGI